MSSTKTKPPDPSLAVTPDQADALLKYVFPEGASASDTDKKASTKRAKLLLRVLCDVRDSPPAKGQGSPHPIHPRAKPSDDSDGDEDHSEAADRRGVGFRDAHHSGGDGGGGGDDDGNNGGHKDGDNSGDDDDDSGDGEDKVSKNLGGAFKRVSMESERYSSKLSAAASYAEKRLSILCKPLSVTLKDQESFFPFLFCLREQALTSDWGLSICQLTPACNLFEDFSTLDGKLIQQNAERRWLLQDSSTSILQLANDQSTVQFASRALQQLLRDSTASTLRQEIVNSIPFSLARDGPLYFWKLFRLLFPTNRLYRSMVIQMLSKVSLQSDCEGDISAYMRRLQQLINLVGTIEAQSQWDLMEQVFAEFQTVSCRPFREEMAKHHTRFIRGTSDWSLTDLFDEARALKDSYSIQGVWDGDSADTELLAMKAVVSELPGIVVGLAGQLSQRSNRNDDAGSSRKPKRQNIPQKPTPEWITNEPDDHTEVREFNNRKWYWCPDCKRWSTTHGAHHPDRQHVKDFKPSARTNKRSTQQNSSNGTTSNGNSPNKRSKFDKKVDRLKSLSAKLSLTQSVAAFTAGRDGGASK